MYVCMYINLCTYVCNELNILFIIVFETLDRHSMYLKPCLKVGTLTKMSKNQTCTAAAAHHRFQSSCYI